MRSAGKWVVVALAALLLGGCATTSQKTIFEKDKTKVLLRGKSKFGTPVDRGFDHPKVIAPVRMAHILSRIDIRTEVDESFLANLSFSKEIAERRAAIPTETLYTIAAGVADGLAQADSSQEVVVVSTRRQRKLGLFHEDFITSFVVYVQDDILYLFLSRSDYQVPKNRERVAYPEVGEKVMRFRILPDTAMTPVDEQALAIAWADPVFKRPSRTRIKPGGKVVRREILMESQVDESGDDLAPVPVVDNRISPDTLRRLADLEERRQAGEVTETEYTMERRAILAADPAAGADAP